MGFDRSWDIRSSMIQSIRYLIEDCDNDKQKRFFAKVIWEGLARRVQSAIKDKMVNEINETMETISCICQYFNEDIIAAIPLMLISAVQTINRIVDLHDK
jgi:hypothetical protein